MNRYTKGVIILFILCTFMWGFTGHLEEKPGLGSGAREAPPAPDLKAASRVTGVPLAEQRHLDPKTVPKKSDGTKNRFLADMERYRMELLALAKKKHEIDRKYAQEQAIGGSKQDMTLLAAKETALITQSTRYAKALNDAAGLEQLGFVLIPENLSDWEGQICNPKLICTKIKPITALFLVVQHGDGGSGKAPEGKN